MKELLYFILLIPFACNINNSLAQDCDEYHKYHCLYADPTYVYSEHSKSALFRRGQSSEIEIVAYAGEEYYVAVCAHRKFGNIRFRILEDNEKRNVVYDNATDDYRESISFSNALTRNLIIEVSVPDKEGSDPSERRCVGVVIEYRKSQSEKEK